MRRRSCDRPVRKRHAKNKDEIILPEDIWIDILLRIPVKQVFQFLRVSKYFKGLIDSDEFIRRHYDVFIKTRPNLLLHQKVKREKISQHYTYDMEQAVIHLDFESGYKVEEFKPPVMGVKSRFVGCCRGILCYQVQVLPCRELLIFWNPLTGVSRRSDSSSNTGGAPHRHRYLFGYDAVTDNFKVVRISDMRHCVIYSSKTDSWTSTQVFDHISTRILGQTGAQVFVEGTNCGHMVVVVYTEGKNILAFDFGSENFNLVPLPKKCTNWDDNMGIPEGLSSVDGCLCYYSATCNRLLNVWIMKEYGVEESWAPLLSRWPYGFAVYNGRPQLVLNGYTTYFEQEKLHLYDVHQEKLTCSVHYLNHLGRPQHFLYAPTHRKPQYMVASRSEVLTAISENEFLTVGIEAGRA